MFLTKLEIDGCLRLYAVITGSVGHLRAASRPLSSPFAFTMRAAPAGCRGDPRRASRSGMEHDVQLWPVALGFWFFRRPEAGLLGFPPDRCLVTGQWHGRHEERPARPFYIRSPGKLPIFSLKFRPPSPMLAIPASLTRTNPCPLPGTSSRGSIASKSMQSFSHRRSAPRRRHFFSRVPLPPMSLDRPPRACAA